MIDRLEQLRQQYISAQLCRDAQFTALLQVDATDADACTRALACYQEALDAETECRAEWRIATYEMREAA
jgi:hypothetical protein